MSDLDQLAGTAPDLAQDIDEVLISQAQIEQKLAEIGAAISEDYAGLEPLLVGVLKGAFMVMADLSRHLTIPTGVDFMACSSYGSSTRSSGVVRILKDLDSDIEGRHVLLVEDIVDSGITLDYLLKNLGSLRPASLEVVALLSKPSHHRVELPVRYLGFEVPDVFVVGYGLDYAERYRGLPFIGTLKPAVYQPNGG
ncbi:MAG: hypoxanthine phosphoribosyltransferase [Nitriliruptorales bacterium]|nr:hypoxanthine phosphoribosyltransferase [Nitriliruptorales bacterium]